MSPSHNKHLKLKVMKTIMKTANLGIAIMIFFSLIGKAQNNEQSVMEQALQSVQTLEVKDAFKITLKQGERNYLKASREDGKALGVSVEDNAGTVRISRTKDSPKGNILLEIEIIDINELKLSGATSMKTEGSITTDRLKLHLSGASDLSAHINASKIALHASGASDVKIEGKTQSLTLDLSGATTVKASGMETDTARVTASGASNVNLSSVNALYYKISGASSLTHKGNPTILGESITGAATVNGKGKTISGLSDTIRVQVGDNIQVFVDPFDKPSDKSTSSKSKPKAKANWDGIGFGVNGWMTFSNELTLPAGMEHLEIDYRCSKVLTINPWEEIIPIFGRHVSLVTGLGFEFNNYRMANNYYLLPNQKQVTAVYDSVNTYKRNKLAVVYANIPLLLQFDTKPVKGNKTIHMSVGVVGGIRLASHYKLLRVEDKVRYNYKVRDDFNLNLLKYGAMLRLGYGNWDFWGQYNLSELFAKNQGPKLYPFSAGINVGF